MVKEEMEFVGFKDFYKRCKKIKEMYLALDLQEKWKYKYYVFSHSLLRDYFKDLIWEYLNEPPTSVYYVGIKKLKDNLSRSRI